jgi:hypothetical protein
MGKATTGGSGLQQSEKVSKVREWVKWESELGFWVFIPLISNRDRPSYEWLTLLGSDRKATSGLQAGLIRNKTLKSSRDAPSTKLPSTRGIPSTKLPHDTGSRPSSSLTSIHRFMLSSAAQPPQKIGNQHAVPHRGTWTSPASFLQLLGLEVREHWLLAPTTRGRRGEQTSLCT